MEAQVTCPNCGSENIDGAHYCAECGSPLEDGAERAKPSAYRPLEQRVGGLPSRDLADLIAETFRVYSVNFRPFVFIAFIPQVPLLISLATPILLSVMFTLIGVVVYVLASAATVNAVAQRYLGQGIDVGRCFSLAWARVVSLIIAFLIFALALVGSAILAFVLIGIPLVFYVLVVWFFFDQAIIIEGRGPTEALRRSQALVRGSWWRVFGIVVVFVVLVFAAALAGTVPGLILPDASTVFGVVVNTVLFPILPIGATLLYFDLRVRKEGYTLDAMASEVGR